MISEALTHKPMTGKCPCRSQSWYIVSISLLIWFTLFYFYSSSVTFGKKSDSFLGNNQTVFIDSSKLSTHDVVEDGTGKNSSRVKNVKIEDNVMNAVDGTKTGGKQIEFYIDRDIDIDRLISSLMTDDNETETFETISGKLLEEELRISARDTEIPIHMGRKNGRRRRRRRRRRGKSGPDPCSGRYIYVHHIPRKFNQDLLDNCPSLSLWTDMCEYTSNLGLGSRLPSNKKLYSERGWFSTNQFLLEVIFHNRMKQYKCLTNDSMVASAVYVPYYAGLDVGRYLWDPIGYRREHDAKELVKWLSGRPEWKTMWGRDHFLVAGRINWDFRKDPNNASDWGNGLLNFPESKNMTMLVIESSPWNNNDFAIPYPTYFHPSRDDDVFRWQDRMRRAKRRLLYSFAGAQRPNQNDSIHNEVINQCPGSKKKCRFLKCDYKSQRCYQPDNLMKLFQSSIFCLQPPGDSYTRRSIFDSILAGCIPVFFHPASAYVQYIWHFPKNHTKYSVLIPASEVKSGNANIEKLLRSIPKKRIAKMRNEVIKLIPNVIYADPASKLEKIKDAFDLTIKGVLDRVETVSEELKDGKEVNSDFDEQESWKYFTFGKLGGHEWDPFFSTKQGKHGT